MDLLLKLLVGVAVGGVVGALGYGVYKLITSDSLKDDVKAELREQDGISVEKIIAAEVKRKGNDEVTLDVFDQWDSDPITEITIHGDEVASDIYIGQLICL